MAEYQDLLDVIARVRNETGNSDAWTNGLSSADLTVVTNPLMNTSGRITQVTDKIRAAHPQVFDQYVFDRSATPSSGAAAEAIRIAETSLVQQNSRMAQLDLQVITAILNAHSTNTEGGSALVDLQRDIESAVASRTDLDTPAGARDFQRYLLGKLRDIRSVVETAGVDATSKAALSAALASLYATGSQHDQVEGSDPEAGVAAAIGDLPATSLSLDNWGSEPLLDSLPYDDALPYGPLPYANPPRVADQLPTLPSLPTIPAVPGIPPMPALGSAGTPNLGLPPAAPFDSSLPDASFSSPHRTASRVESNDDELPSETTEFGAADEEDRPNVSDESVPEEDLTKVSLPNGESVTAASPELAKIITAVVEGTPISQAFAQQGITIPAPGSVVAEPVDVTHLTPGDIGIFTDRHALALGNGKAILDNRIQEIMEIAGPTFLGWEHPPEPGHTIASAKSDRPAVTMPELTVAPSG